jgi:hypothetical protein
LLPEGASAVIDLPQPDSPTKPSVPPASTPNDSSRNAATRPWVVGSVTVRLVTDSSGKVNRAPGARVLNDNALHRFRLPRPRRFTRRTPFLAGRSAMR